MKLKLLGLIAFLVISPQFVGAQDLEPSPTPINVGQVMRLRKSNNVKIQNQLDARNAKKEERALEREGEREERQAMLTEKRQERIANLYARLEKRILAATERMNKLIVRIQVRLETLKGEGQDVALLESQVSQAQSLIESTNEMLVSLQSTMELLLESEEPKAVYPVIKDAVKGIKDTLKDSHSILVNVVTQIKGLRVGSAE